MACPIKRWLQQLTFRGMLRSELLRCCDPLACRPAIALTCRRWHTLLLSEPLLWSTVRIETAQLDFLSR